MVRVDPDQSDSLVTATTATVVDDAGPPHAWVAACRLRVICRAEGDLAAWEDRGTGYARSLPPKRDTPYPEGHLTSRDR